MIEFRNRAADLNARVIICGGLLLAIVIVVEELFKRVMG